jgi:sugar phosphate isomerase/epimerase
VVSLPVTVERSIHPRLSVSEVSSVSWTLQEDLEFYRQAGIGTVGISHMKLLPNVAGSVAAIQAAGLRCACLVAGERVMPSLIPTAVPGARSALDILGPAIDAAADLGGPVCYFTSGPTPPRTPTDDAYEALMLALQPVTAYAATKGVPLAVENNSTSTRGNGFIHTLIDAVELSRDAGIGVIVELQNCWMERNLDRIFREHFERFALIQVSDFMVGEAARLNRRVPGDGSMPLEWMLERVLDAGYQGLFEVELVGPAIEEEGYASAIGRSLNWLSERLATWGV